MTAFGSSYLEEKNVFDKMKLSLIIQGNIYELGFPGISKLWRTEDEIEFEELVKGIHYSVMEIMKKREEKDENKRISLEDLVDERKTFYIAGQEPPSSLFAWIILLLAIHPDWKEEAKIFGQEKPNPDGIAKPKKSLNSYH
ncbi:hypothetical protein DKX38_015866 [Salix brachista]|uniref:Cytochrome P450 n=1 Tax=Salix brachista TaxID=2182728 RepID=A0A5N5L6F3_9ROSI|nr:hypothetical protein DKX38_015866 [Salix brachista]